MVNTLILILPILINVAFVTLIERKILGLRQLRLGPNKTRFQGLLQPFRDAIKLFIKQTEKILSGNTYLYFMAPASGFSIALMVWIAVPLIPLNLNSKFRVILFIIILSLGVYPLLLSGWASVRKYAIIGRIRGVAQTISYEIRLALILIVILTIFSTTNFYFVSKISYQVLFFIMIPLLILMWVISIIAETNRTPFDFAEGESELVSGFNVEYASVGFALIFIAEYSIILVLATFTIILFIPRIIFSIKSAALSISLAFFWIWLRATYPRYRYDLLISLAWKSILPQTLGILSIISSLILLLNF